MRSAYLRLADADLTRPLVFAILSIVYLALRVPYLGYGHGTDPDAWRVAMTAHHFWATGDYFPSRLPGNPAHEFVTILLIPGGWVATNLATALVSLAGVYVFGRIMVLHRLPNQALLVVGFAFAPLLFINSIATMDYMWALTAILAAYYCVATGRPLWAGVLLGLSIGFRLQSAVVWLPLAYIAWRHGRREEILPMSLAAAGVTLLCFAPVLVTYGTEFLNYYDAPVAYDNVARLLGKEALGVLGGLGVLAGMLISLPRLRLLLKDVRAEAYAGAWLLVILLYVVSFSNLPHEVAYLIPVFPFGMLIMARYFSRAGVAVAIGAVLLAGVVDVTTPGEGLGGSLREATIGRGLVLSNAVTMDKQRDFVRQVMDADVPDHSVVMTGFIFPQLAVRERDRLESRILQRDYDAISMLSDSGEAVDVDRDVRYIWLADFETFEALRHEGYSLFMVPDAARSTVALYDYRLGLFGVTYLRLDVATPSISGGTGGTDR